MALDDDIRILSGVSLFEGFTQEQLRLLAFGAESSGCRPAEKLYSRRTTRPIRPISWSAAASRCYREHDGERVVVGHAGPGAMLGELALIADTSG